MAYFSRVGARPSALTAAIIAGGFVLTASTVWASKQVDDQTEQRLLERQTGQAAALLSSSIQVNQQPLMNALEVQPAGRTSDPELFRRSISGSVGADRTFVAASIWQRAGDRLVRRVALGVEPAMAVDGATTQTHLMRAFATSTVTVTLTSLDGQRRVAYALADSRAGRVVTAERAIPANGRSRLDSDPAFADLYYANYLGPSPVKSALTTTNVDPEELPLTGLTAKARVPFGDTVLTLVTAPRGHLGSPLSDWLPVLLLVAGSLSTVVVAILSQLLVRRRQAAEDSAALAVGLSERLQRALLPLAIPEVPHVEVAVKYVAGTRGVDIGGDWYSFIALDTHHFAFVVGDVSGKGIDAVAVMARARFTLRAYLLRGDSPDVALSKSAPQFNVGDDGHIVTAVVGIGNWTTGELSIANAGHCRPLLLGAGESRFLDVVTGPPLGVGPFTYTSSSFTMASEDVLLCYTDGLIERRNEGIDAGMERLATTVSAERGSVADLVDHAVNSLRTDQAEDDIAVLAFRWSQERTIIPDRVVPTAATSGAS